MNKEEIMKLYKKTEDITKILEIIHRAVKAVHKEISDYYTEELRAYKEGLNNIEEIKGFDDVIEPPEEEQEPEMEQEPVKKKKSFGETVFGPKPKKKKKDIIDECYNKNCRKYNKNNHCTYPKGLKKCSGYKEK